MRARGWMLATKVCRVGSRWARVLAYRFDALEMECLLRAVRAVSK